MKVIQSTYPEITPERAAPCRTRFAGVKNVGTDVRDLRFVFSFD